MDWLAEFDYDIDPATQVAAQQLVLATVPQHPWSPVSPKHGGRLVAASGATEAWTTRTDRNLLLRLRCTEEQLPLVEQMVDYLADTAEPGRFRPMAGQPSVAFYLDKPVQGDEFKPERDPQAPWMWVVELTIRRVDGLRWNLPYYPDPEA